MYSQLDMSLAADAMFWSICLIAFYSYFRKSNLLVPSVAKFDTEKHLRQTDLLMFTWGIPITVNWSKVIQFRPRTLYVTIPKTENSLLFPLQAYRHAVDLAPPTQPSEPAFITYINGKMSPFTYGKFAVKLRNKLKLAGINPENYSGHSFRRGRTTFAMRSGVPFPLIKCQADWASDAFERYLATTLQERLLSVAMTAKANKSTNF